MRFSVITPCRLIPYQNCAQFMDQKLIRSVQSVLAQSFTDFELIVIADGCQQTKDIITANFTDRRIQLLECEHKQVFDNLPRNTGIAAAKGDYIIYIDADDYWGPNHLEIINRNLTNYDWVYYNDFVYNGNWVERACNIRLLGGCGTSNVCHARKLNLKWDRPGYSHDYYFNQKLVVHPNNNKIETPEYYVCHAPLVAGGWDI